MKIDGIRLRLVSIILLHFSFGNEQTRCLLVLGAGLAALLDLLQNGLTVLIELELVDDDLAGVDAHGHALAAGLVARHTLDVDNVLEAVDGGDLALAALEGATDDGDLVILADGDAADLRRELASCSGASRSLGRGKRHTLYFSRSSLLRGALMMVRRTLEGAEKCALRDLRLEEWVSAFQSSATQFLYLKGFQLH